MVHGKPFWDRVGREGGIIGALQRSWDRGWPGSEGADHWTIVLFFNFCENSAWIIGSLDHWSKLELPPHNKPLLLLYEDLEAIIGYHYKVCNNDCGYYCLNIARIANAVQCHS